MYTYYKKLTTNLTTKIVQFVQVKSVMYSIYATSVIFFANIVFASKQFMQMRGTSIIKLRNVCWTDAYCDILLVPILGPHKDHTQLKVSFD